MAINFQFCRFLENIKRLIKYFNVPFAQTNRLQMRENVDDL